MSLINVRDRKRELRARFRRYRAECPPALKRELDQKLFERFTALPEYRQADVLLAYISRGIECDTAPIIRDALQKGKRVAVPKCREHTNEIDFYFIQSYDDLRVGRYGVMEPDSAVCEQAEDVSRGLCLVPGLGFDLLGYRLGFGGGYYDRFLSGFGGTTVGVCYAKCTVGELPRGVFDRAVDIVITEKFCNRTQR
ncbi:MAG: 5-formyltetrahydrofolate cyclo-ligase [Ruminococcus sp.]|nr:5-formyltetrahydrofolate cyclo-ligase [Ruminococcus sp.]